MQTIRRPKPRLCAAIFPVCIILASIPLRAFAQDTAKTLDHNLVGVILPFSSPFQSIADEQKNAIEIALAESSGAVKIIYQDSREDAAGAVDAFRQLAAMQRPPVAIISCASWVATAIHPLAAEKGIFHIVIGSAAFDRTIPRHTVRFTIDALEEERLLAGYLDQFSRIAIFNMDNGYGNTWARNIEKRFAEKIVAAISYNPRDTDFRIPLDRIAKAKPEALVLLSAQNAAAIAQQARKIGIAAQLVGTRPIERPELLKLAKYTNGLVYTYPSYNTLHPFVAAYRKARKATPTVFASEAYDAIETLLRALREGNHSPEALFAWYAGRQYTGALGQVNFDRQGDASYACMYKQIAHGKFQIADFQFPILLENARREIENAFQQMDQTVQDTARQLAETGLEGPRAKEALAQLHRQNPHACDCIAIDPRGIIVNVAPEKYDAIRGTDISAQEQVTRLQNTRMPVVSQAIDTVEGFLGIDLEHPVFDKSGKLIGAVSILTEPDFFGKIISPKLANFPVEIWIMQKDGRIVYDINKEEIGKNLFTDPIYQDYPSLRQIGRKMAIAPLGTGQYTFLDKNLKTPVEKTLMWSTIALHGAEFRIALARASDLN